MQFEYHKGSMTKETFDLIQELLPHGSTILEMGSGYGTKILSEYYTMYSIEHNPKWINSHDSNYIYCPVVQQTNPVYQRQDLPNNIPGNILQFNEWYDIDTILDQLPKKYDMLFIDGPNSDYRRTNFISHIDKFNTNAVWLFDDVNREFDRRTYEKVCEIRNKKINSEEAYVVDCTSPNTATKWVGVIK